MMVMRVMLAAPAMLAALAMHGQRCNDGVDSCVSKKS
jgi:hypothetical protein